MIRRTLTGAPDVEVGVADLALAACVTTPPEPAVGVRAALLEPPVATASGLEADPPVPVTEADLRAAVDVVAHPLVEPPFGIRSQAPRLPVPRVEAMALVATEIRSPAARIPEPPLTRADPPWLSVVERLPTPPAALPRVELQRMLVALYRASGAASPRDLTLVGIYRRVPGGAIGKVAMEGDRVRLQVNRRRRGRAATLVVGRTRDGGRLVTAEIYSA